MNKVYQLPEDTEVSDFLMKLTETATLTRAKDYRLRIGQTLFNTLLDMHSELAEDIRGNSDIDPFYKDENIHNFFNYIFNHLKDGEPT